jgi:signal transduction histidine kinase/FixJ family two-component response regulator
MIEPPPERYVLCLDDDPDFIKSLEAFLPERVNALRSDGLWYRFVFLQDPAEALEVLGDLMREGARVAMLISDQQMPSMKGIELLRRSRELSPGSMRILLTGHAGIEAAITAINDRLLDRYLTKPIENETEFTLSVKQLLEHFEMRQVIEQQAAALQELYRFANAVNALEDLDGMLETIARSSQSILGCRQSAAIVRGEEGALRGAVMGIDRSGPGWPALATTGGPGPPVGRASHPEQLPPDVAAAIRAAGIDPSGPIAYGRLAAHADPIGWILVGGRGSALSDVQLQTLGYLADTASIAIHKQLVWTRLEEANRRLATLDEIKSEFLRFISHELRTPLSYMSAIGLMDHPLTAKEWAEIGGIVRNGYKRLDAFITAGLDYFSWSGRSQAPSEEIVDWARIVEGEWIDDLVGQGLRRTSSARSCRVRMSEATARTVLIVLVENAIKFSPDPPSLEIELTASADRMRLALRDRGRGFEPEIGPELFRPFTVLETLHHREGTGLNLARTAAIVEAHGGRVEAHSEGRGKGATFVIELPLLRSGEASEDSGQSSDPRAA